MNDDLLRQEILSANARFYTALAEGDLAAMSDIWHHGPETECVHPGWDRLRGWPAIRESWSLIFQNQGSLPVQPSEMLVHWRGEMAWVTCYENITVREGASVQISQTLATNVLNKSRAAGEWLFTTPRLPSPRPFDREHGRHP